ncbi:MAG: helix-turn-helix domain-containing protein [Muribaculaceae bacterium]|nr:helix-turn-helix domain-containing protein [Muribaculaceae bacterium]
MTKIERLKKLIEYYTSGKPSVFAKHLGVAPSTISSWLARDSMDYDLIFAKCENLNPTWLLTGNGEMILDRDVSDASYSSNIYSGIPLIPVEAMAGYLSGEVSVSESDCERLNIPGLKADFVIPVSGDSMEPKYFSGDYVACQNVNLSDLFFQWGKVYVIDTNQGVLLKKVKKGSDPNCVILISENSEYDPIQMPRKDIYHIALVKGLVRII